MNKLKSAIKYARQGFYVLPMNGKKPLIKFANNPPLTVDEIRCYWTKYPDANIALRTVNFFVVDVDTKQAHGADGIKSLKSLPNGIILPSLAQTTASGGCQLFYKKPANVEIKQVIGWLDGVDIKANVNNYVVVPPSTTEKGVYQWINNSPINAPSSKLIDLINRHQSINKASFNNHYQTTGKKWTGIVLDNLVKGAPQGQRNDYLTRLCGQLVHAQASTDAIWQLMNYANQFNTPPLESRELETIITSIIKRG